MSDDVAGTPVTIGQRLTDIATERPDDVALVVVAHDGTEVDWTWGRLEGYASRIATILSRRGVVPGMTVCVCVPNGPEHVGLALGAWKLGATVLPLRWDLPSEELSYFIRLAAPATLIGRASEASTDAIDLDSLQNLVSTTRIRPVEAITPKPFKAIASGGTTGLPKLIVDARSGAFVPGEPIGSVGLIPRWAPDGRTLISGPLYHLTPFNLTHLALFQGQKVVLMRRFEPRAVMSAIERHRVTDISVVPTMLSRILRDTETRHYDLSSIQRLTVGGASCPETVKHEWLNLLEPTRLFEAYGSTEGIGQTVIRGDEWLAHPGSVGRPVACDLLLLDEQLRPVPTGTVAEIFMRPHSGPSFFYRGAEPRVGPDGFLSVGDLGWLDSDQYLHIADRRDDMIVTGGANVYSAEVERALLLHPDIEDAAVIGVPDDDWGRRIHAVLQCRPNTELTYEAIKEHCLGYLARYKIPKSIQLVTAIPRNAMGKVRKRDLITQEENSTT